MNKCVIKWKSFSSKTVVPTKTKDAAGYDVYTTEDYVVIPAHGQHMFKTDLAYVIEGPYWLMAFDRGSTGSKGLHVHCGVCDKDYRGEVFICIKNDNNYPVVVTRSVDKAYIEDMMMMEDYCGKVLFYPASKAIAQLIPIEMPEIKIMPINEAEWDIACNKSERGSGKLGSSGK